MTGSVFPAIIKSEYQPGDGFPAFRRDVELTLAQSKAKFDSVFADIGTDVQKALKTGLNGFGAVSIDVTAYRRAADAAEQNAVALREVAAAARVVAQADPTPVLRRQAQAAEAAAIEARQDAIAAAQEAVARERLQEALNRNASAIKTLESASRGTIGSIGAQRQAYIGLGQQLQDSVIQAQLGTSAFTILAQQGSQAAFQLSGLGGTAGRFASFLAGPWGAAIFGGVAVLGYLTMAMSDNRDAAELAKVGADGLSSAQSTLGEIFDLTSGRIQKQNELLRLNARLTAINLRAEAAKERSDSISTLNSSGDLSFFSRFTTGSTDRVGGPGNIKAVVDARTKRVAEIRAIARAVQQGQLDEERALRASEGLNFDGLSVTRQQFQQAIIGRVSSSAKDQTARLIDQSLNSGVLAPAFLKPTKDKKGRKGPSAETLANREFRTREFGEDTADQIARITESFDRTPATIARVNASIRQLDDLATDVEKRKPPNYAELVDQIGKARDVVKSGLVAPFDELVRSSSEQAKVQRLIAEGRDVEAEALSRVLSLQVQMGPLTAAQQNQILTIVAAEKRRAEAIEVTNKARQRELSLVEQTSDNTREAIRDLVSGRGIGSIGDALKRQFSIVQDELATQINEQIFGDTFRKQRLKILGLDRVDEAGSQLAIALEDNSNRLSAANDATVGQLDRLAKAASSAADALADQEGGDIVVTARTKNTDNKTAKELRRVSNDFGKLGNVLKQALVGASYGQAASGTARSVGIKQSKLGAQIGGAAGYAIAGPIGGLIGGFLGGTIGGAFKKTPKGSTSISSLSGDLSYSGSGKLKDSVLGFGDDVRGNLSRIIESLNGTAGSFSVSVGQRGKKFTVDPTGQGRTKGSGVQKFATQEEAARAALLDAINDGAVQGIRQGAQNLLRAGSDLDAQLSKAVRFQSVFDRLREITDPVGAAIATLDREFTGLKSVFQEAGASAQEYADLEKLYGIERAKAIQAATDAVSGSLSQLYKDLTTGDNGRSLRDRLAAQSAVFDPLKVRVQAGDITAFDDFSEAGRSMLDIIRQIEGSGEGYFSFLDELTGLSKSALDRQAAVAAAAGGGSTPFGPSPTSANTPVVDAIGTLETRLVDILGRQLSTLNASNDNLGTMIGLLARANAGGVGIGGLSNF